ncbi:MULTISPECIES: MOSC domain-containing protein [unclassified Duganella]|uniref:MOSC domain-containing protein n=1 Tax=unclassified Duganella TaxID=2636909 RepID=UPI000880D3E1|nr:MULTISPECIES: MOSC domain-containing protein [unclassified Duganella]SDH56659.1 MOSC domain-containing protein YiiM [Duganella sp. OV458]SDK66796.1 MOSC domain-containing protein YiiM [Duganella sp. OV510]
MSVLIQSLLVGKARPLPRDGHADVLSGIVKLPQDGKVWLSINGLQGDEQGDRAYHGGPEKALHHYAAEHYPHWRSLYADGPVEMVAGAFGENISTVGMTERDVCVGDVYRVGSALLQVSQGRQPCWKLNRLLRRDGAALAMQESGATGWYYRVLQEGWLGRGDGLELVERPQPAWPMARLISVLFSPALLRDEWRQAAEIAQLTSNWRTTFSRRLQTGQVEDWVRRLLEPL